MSDNSFEKAVGEKLRALPDTFTYHPPDDPATRQWKPCDFLVCRRGRFIGIECKEIQGSTFPHSRWSPQQQGFAHAITLAGGLYYLVVRFMPSALVIRFSGLSNTFFPGGSLEPRLGLALNAGRGFDIEPATR